MAETLINRGSYWSKWDLHLHAPSRYSCTKKDDFKGVDLVAKTNTFIEELKKISDISVVGITDYFSLDGFKEIIKHKDELPNINLIIPNIELRILPATGDNRKINLHIIANTEILEVSVIEDFLCKFKVGNRQNKQYSCKERDLIDYGKELDSTLSDDKAFEKGLNEFVISYDTFFNEYDNMDEQFKTNTLIGISNNSTDGASGIKDIQGIRNIIYKGVDLIFSSNPSDIDYFLGKAVDKPEEIRRKYGKLKPCIHGSDYHGSKHGAKICEPDQKRFCWIKSQPNFKGLKQIIYEPEERIKIQPIKPEGASDSFTIDKVEYKNGEVLNLNEYLNSIIGVRASGKSTLIKNIAKNVDIKEYNKKTKEELLPIPNLKVFWADGEVNNGDNDNKTILFIPQNFLSTLVHGDTKNKNDLKIFIKELFERNSLFKSKLDSWEKTNQQIDKKTYDLLINLFDSRSKYSETLDLAKKEGRESDAGVAIKKLESDIEKVRKESELSVEALEDYKKKKEEESINEDSLRTLETDEESLETLLGMDIVDVDVIQELVLSAKIEKKIKSQLRSEDSIVKKFLRDEIAGLKKQIAEIGKKLAKLKVEIKPVEEKMTKESLIKELADRLNEEKKRLDKIKKLSERKKDLNDQIERVQQEIINTFTNRKKAIDDLILGFNNFGKEFEFIKIKLVKQFEKDKISSVRESVNFHNSVDFKKEKTKYEGSYSFLNEGSLKDELDLAKELFSLVLDKKLNLKAGINEITFATELFSNWYNINYQDAILDKKDNTHLLDMSDGQKMNALLELLFSFDDYSFPILIDQPEDDLDVKAIADTVVRFIKHKKKTRQIILVSHNANLVIGADSENIIVANKTVKSGKVVGFNYINGAIEDPEIRSEAVNILEGGEQAFINRGEKLELI